MDFNAKELHDKSHQTRSQQQAGCMHRWMDGQVEHIIPSEDHGTWDGCGDIIIANAIYGTSQN